MERTLIIAKPDAIQRGLVGEIVKRFEQKGLKLIGLKMIQLDDVKLDGHYAEHIDKPFYADLAEYMKSSPVVVMAWEGYECINSVRIIVGSTNPRQADAGTIRGDFAIGQGRNLVHASDGKESGEREVAHFFGADELMTYDKSEYMHVYNQDER
ncbi:nucleoside-diphosphate kinase [Candidatus Saccharibacteria bacterium]|nr:nucleoside-diphosphate kinase [Candidatus Saccharibacteria bacterium]MCA9337302.1 nucleoside-diphosphate kinase [Candidatus Saccharibacteria bacterium]